MKREGSLRFRFWGYLLALAGLLALLALSGCSSDSYDNLTTDYYQNDASAVTTVDAPTVLGWVQNGMRTDSGKRVVILDCVPNPAGVFPNSDVDAWFAGDRERIKTNMAAQYGMASPQYLMIDMLDSMGFLGHIPGALPNVSHEGYEVTPRVDGPILAEHEVGTGSLIDQMVQGYGITKDDVIVLSTSRLDYPGFCPSRLWWTLYYWGFSRDHIMILNGGNKAYAMAGGTLEKGVVKPVVKPSTFCPTTLGRRNLDARISLGELISLVDSGRTSLPDDDPDKVVVIDTRQPPVAYFFKDGDANGTPDVFEVTVNGYSYDPTSKDFVNAGGNHITLSEFLFNEIGIPFNAAVNPPIDLSVPPASTYLGMNVIAPGQPIAIPLAPKPAAFEGKIKGAKVVKSSTYNITIPALLNPDGTYKSKADLLPIFAAAGIDGTKPIITYCNSGALASIYFYVLKQICGFEDVRLYDGSWQEWANLAAFEPVTTDYVMTDDYVAYPSYPAGSPKLQFFAGMNNYFEYDAASDQFVDTRSGAVIGTDKIKAGGNLAGDPTWDTVTRSEHVMFRPTASLNGSADPFNIRTYKSATDWPAVETYPSYDGAGSEIRLEDEAFLPSAGSGDSGGDAPSAFVPAGGGC
ncbi:MAG: hypothetical protein D6751_01675 [Deltaproteobacteria bacterium]|nr:MAG: hypothetical protein D6751_01675 [Deltaproteobacteria bacterium]